MSFKLLSTKEAIESRRSIRAFKPDTISDEIIMDLLESARLAPSGCNSQPWRFKIVKDTETKAKLQNIAFNQKFVSQAPVVLVVCADIQGYLDGRTSGIQDLGKVGVFNESICEILHKATKKKSQIAIETLRQSVAFNVAIAIEHIVLRALDFGLGTCWVRLMNEKEIRTLFGWNDNTYPVALIPIGYPKENPSSRKRKPIKDFILD